MTEIATRPGAASSGSPISLLYAARALRGFGDGFAIINLPAYMTALGYDAIAVGLVATASLLGTALLTLVVGWIAPRHDLRALMSEIRPDWDLSTPGLREAWNAGDLSRFHGWNKRGAAKAPSAGQKE